LNHLFATVADILEIEIEPNDAEEQLYNFGLIYRKTPEITHKMALVHTII